ncbi:MAG: Rossmann-like and DUF2520 domain-containing protein [Pseudonocardiaceae bacterium]
MPRSDASASNGVADRPARLAVGVVSAGRVGSVLGAALTGAGHVVVGVSAVSRASLRRAANLLPDAPVLPPDDVVRRSDLVLLAVPDEVLPGLVVGLARTGAFRAGQIVVHTSGARGVDLLASAIVVSVLPLALHPAMTFTGRAEDVARLAASCVGVTVADETGWSVGEALVLEMGAEPVRVPPEARPLYHAALAHGSNHLATLVRDAVDALEHAGVVPAERLLGPLLEATLDNTLRHGDRALTGPVARGDLDTVRLHLRVLAESAPELLEPYRAQAARTADRAEAAGLLAPAAASQIRESLQERR